jgi:hypothetical protein
LRSKYHESLIKVCALVEAGRVSPTALGADILKSDKTWSGACNWEIQELEKRGLVYVKRTRMYGRGTYALTMLGDAALNGAMKVRGQDLGLYTHKAIERVDRALIN